MFALILDKEAVVKIHQAVIGACVAAALMLGAGARPSGQIPAAAESRLVPLSVQVLRDRLLSVALDAAGEIEARIKEF